MKLRTKLSVSNKQLVIARPEHRRESIPIEDLGVVIVDDVRATYTQAVFIELTNAGTCVLICGRDHLPASMMLPLVGHHTQTERQLAQVKTSVPRKKRVWQALVKAKIIQQAAVLSHFSVHNKGLIQLASRVKSGDPQNVEAHAAQRYWPALLGDSFRRNRDQPDYNALLNYGYAVIRATVARAIVATGLMPSFGVHHKNRRNPFCLADDLLEPYRPFVDWRVKQIALDTPKDAMSLESRPIRARLLSLLNESVNIGEWSEPMLVAIQTSADSLRKALTGDGIDLLLPPHGMPLVDAAEEVELQVSET